MNSKVIRFFQALLVALFVLTSLVGPAYAQSAPSREYKDVQVVMQDGWSTRARHSAADDFAIACPTKEVLDPQHPCSSASIQPVRFDDYVLVCPGPGKELAGDHPCNQRSAQIKNARPKDFVLVCPMPGYDLPGDHPCNQLNSVSRFEIPGDYVLTCPTSKDVLEDGHPCARRTLSR